jgi:hypothetical protein
VFRAGQALRLKRAVLVVDRERLVRQAHFPVTDIPGAVRAALAVVRQAAERLTGTGLLRAPRRDRHVEPLKPRRPVGGGASAPADPPPERPCSILRPTHRH